jgi:hypothetical protein
VRSFLDELLRSIMQLPNGNCFHTHHLTQLTLYDHSVSSHLGRNRLLHSA